jgi:hypothetical protein
MVQQTDKYKENTLQRVARFNTSEVFSKIVGVLENTLSDCEINEMLEHDAWNVFHHNSESSSRLFSNLSKEFHLKNSKKGLKTSEVDGWNLFHFDACNENHQIAGFVFQFVSEILRQDSAVAMLKETEWRESENIFHLLAKLENHENFDQLLALVQVHLKVDEIHELIEKKSKNGENMLDIQQKYSEIVEFLDNS